MVAKSNRRRKSISVIDLSSLASLLHPTIQRLSVLSLTTFPFHRRQSFMDNRSFNSTFRSYLCPVSVPHYYKSLCVPSCIDFVQSLDSCSFLSLPLAFRCHCPLPAGWYYLSETFFDEFQEDKGLRGRQKLEQVGINRPAITEELTNKSKRR